MPVLWLIFKGGAMSASVVPQQPGGLPAHCSAVLGVSYCRSATKHCSSVLPCSHFPSPSPGKSAGQERELRLCRRSSISSQHNVRQKDSKWWILPHSCRTLSPTLFLALALHYCKCIPGMWDILRQYLVHFQPVPALAAQILSVILTFRICLVFSGSEFSICAQNVLSASSWHVPPIPWKPEMQPRSGTAASFEASTAQRHVDHSGVPSSAPASSLQLYLLEISIFWSGRPFRPSLLHPRCFDMFHSEPPTVHLCVHLQTRERRRRLLSWCAGALNDHSTRHVCLSQPRRCRVRLPHCFQTRRMMSPQSLHTSRSLVLHRGPDPRRQLLLSRTPE